MLIFKKLHTYILQKQCKIVQGWSEQVNTEDQYTPWNEIKSKIQVCPLNLKD